MTDDDTNDTMTDNAYRPNIPKDRGYIEGLIQALPKKDHFEVIHFEYLTDALKLLGIADDPYQLMAGENPKPEDVEDIGRRAYAAIQSGLSDVAEVALLRGWDYLAKEDPLRPADLIFVFGGPGEDRVQAAIALHREGYAPKILFTGQKASYMNDVQVSEAEYYADIARKAGIPDTALILETQARNTPENAVNSVRILKEQGCAPATIILVTLPYHMLRSYHTLKTVTDWNPVLICRPTASPYTRTTYFHDPKGWMYVFSEYMKLYAERLMKHF